MSRVRTLDQLSFELQELARQKEADAAAEFEHERSQHARLHEGLRALTEPATPAAAIHSESQDFRMDSTLGVRTRQGPAGGPVRAEDEIRLYGGFACRSDLAR
ncbi:hypothetical protein [Cognatilysobacter tabacisoli]|uniref:hypothetical protein n=1 Tax=Cognatilysobacter tabacisoli TaxID=2315424 RepID=UPI000E6B3A40|nr:hypothetical protein [Lysobacter tabacisoli]